MLRDRNNDMNDINAPKYIWDAIREHNRLGRNECLTQYGFATSKKIWLHYEGLRYRSKAIDNVAHQFAKPDLGPLKASNYSVGKQTVQRILEKLSFVVEVDG